MRFKTVVTGTLIACMVGSAWSMTLGRTRGAAWIGQPLELQITVQLDAGQTAADLCSDADVFYGDTKIEASRVRVVAEAASQADTATLRLSSAVAVDEPMVTVYLRAGCNTRSTRRYVLLADFPTENAAPPARVVAEPVVPMVPPAVRETAPAIPAPTPATATVGPQKTPTAVPVREAVNPPTPPVAPPKAPTPKEAVPAAKPARSTAKAAAAPVAPNGQAKARLKLDPIENLAERIKTLEATTSAVPLEDMVKDNQRMQQLQKDMQALLTQAAKNEAAMLALRERLEQAESERVSVLWVYGLFGLLVLCAGGLFLLWNRRAEKPIWHNSHSSTTVMAPQAVEPDTPPSPVESASIPTQLAPLPQTHDVTGVDVDLMDMDADAFGRLLSQRVTDHAALAPAQHASQSRVHFNNDSSFDALQQAEFYVKLGKTDQAIEVLEQRIRTNPADCPMVYLELLRIANTYSLKTDFRQFREEFERVFNARVPEFALFRDEGRSLESYPALMQHITALWPAASVMDVIEACILRDPELMNAEPFDLAAFRELITLHGLVHAHHFDEKKLESEDSQHVNLDF